MKLIDILYQFREPNLMPENGIDQSEYWVERAESFWRESNKNEQAAKETLNFVDKAISINPLSSKAWADKGFILKQLGEYETALLCLDRALALNRDFISPWYNKGVLLGLMGKFHEAVNCYEEVLKQDPNHKLAKRDVNVLRQILNDKKQETQS
jgi:tetratricopeptide (TPR) repeat protein